MRSVILSCLMLAVLISCKSSKKTIQMEGTYEVTFIRVEKDKEIDLSTLEEQEHPEKAPYIKINSTTKKITGSTGYNLFGTQINPEGNELNMGPVLATRKSGEKVADFEKDFLSAMNSVKTYSLEDGELQLKSANGDNLIIAKRIKD